ncbi:MAG TPA: hypothetical protein VFT29_14380 [Gemmatimonadaceae bacterium]|nr:hypothetical protein [Gemmatimonadaceae bacterium]
MFVTLLFEIQPTDLVTYVGVALTIGGVGMLAALVPAWRASTANPATSLRAE